ncbi:MAG: lysoplasmalogenase [Bacteroidales bacterium]|nr:lysoplasmalogenase [Bacteroidales bacterium]
MKPLSYIIFFLGIAGFFYGYETGNLLVQTISKPVPVIVLILSVKRNTAYNQLITIGFILSLIGDVLLAKMVDKFLLGLVSFLFAHAVYILAFLKKSKRLAFIESVPFYAYGAILFFFLQSHLGKMSTPVLAYIIVITTMLWRSFVQRKSGKIAKYAFYGALFFTLSDTLIAIYRFYQAFDFDREATILTYWTAQYLIFLSTSSKKIR